LAEHRTVVAPGENTEPESALHETGTAPSTLSVAEAEKLTATPFGFSVCTVILPGRESVGATLSSTVTEKLPEAVLPDLSLAAQLTLVVPTGKVEPEAGEHDTLTAPSTESNAEVWKVAATLPDPFA
jgi:hypothetical protein